MTTQSERILARKVTIKDIAKEAGISYQAVSAILKQDKASQRFSESTRDKVIQIAKKLNYSPSLIARGFRSEQSFLIGVQLYHLIHSYDAAEYIYGLQERLIQDNYSPIFLFADSLKKEKENIERFKFRNVDGCILSPLQRNPDFYSELKCPCVQIGIHVPELPIMKQDMFHFGYDATKKFINSGRRKIALLTHNEYRTAETTPYEKWDAWEQFLGYKSAMEEASLTIDVRTFPIRTQREDSVRWYWDTLPLADEIVKDKSIDAVLCYSTFSAYSLLEAAKSIGRKIPDELALIGYGRFTFNSVLSPQITSYDVNWSEIGSLAAESILKRISKQNVSDQLIKPLFIQGETL